jgi:hypothetical protein
VGTCHRFVAAPAEPLDVLSWFRGLPTPPRVAAEEYGFALLFGDLGPLHYRADGFIDAERSPVVTIHAPKLKRGVLWTVGEVRFLSTPLKKRYPQLHKVNTAFAKWLSGFEDPRLISTTTTSKGRLGITTLLCSRLIPGSPPCALGNTSLTEVKLTSDSTPFASF